MQRAEIELATAGDSNLLRRTDEPKQREDLQTAARVQLAHPFERRAVDRVQEVDRNRVGVDVAQREGDVDELLVPLPHARDESRARRDAGALHGLERGDAVVVGVRRRDVPVVVAAGVEVVVVPVDAGFPQRERVLVRQQTEARTHLQRELVLDLTDRGRHLSELALTRTPAARDDAIRAGPPRPRLARAVDQHVTREQLVLRDRGRRDDRLGAVAAVLGTDPALRVDEHVELHLAPEVGATDAEGGIEDLQELIVVGREDGARLAARQRLARERLVGERLPAIGDLERHDLRHAQPPSRGSRRSRERRHRCCLPPAGAGARP